MVASHKDSEFQQHTPMNSQTPHKGNIIGTGQPAPFTWSSLWGPAVLNPINLKSSTLPIFNLRSAYSRNFHLSWLGFIVAFLSWFAFPPLIPEAIKSDLKLTQAQIGNSNIVALSSTLGVRLVVGPLVDRFGPRKVMAWILILGAIPSGLAGTVSSAEGLYVVRFFIGILGGSFVPCQAWTTAFFDKNIVGTANALVGGWGNMGGGVTFVVMTALYDSLLSRGLTQHTAWRAAFAIVPVPVLLFVAALTLMFGTDHPAGRWSERHTLPATRIAELKGHVTVIDHGEQRLAEESSDIGKKESAKKEKASEINVTVQAVADDPNVTSELDVAINEALTFKTAISILANPLTWLPALAYLTTFGFELAVDATLANILFDLYQSPDFGQTKAGYITAVYGLLNLWTRPIGGWLGDRVYPRFGVPGKKYLTLACGLLQGALALAFGLYVEDSVSRQIQPSLAVVIAVIVLLAIVNEAGNGANFSLVPHCNAYSNGFMSGIVGATGNLGGILFALVFRFQLGHGGRPFWISGIICLVINVVIAIIPVPAR